MIHWIYLIFIAVMIQTCFGASQSLSATKMLWYSGDGNIYANTRYLAVIKFKHKKTKRERSKNAKK